MSWLLFFIWQWSWGCASRTKNCCLATRTAIMKTVERDQLQLLEISAQWTDYHWVYLPSVFPSYHWLLSLLLLSKIWILCEIWVWAKNCHARLFKILDSFTKLKFWPQVQLVFGFWVSDCINLVTPNSNVFQECWLIRWSACALTLPWSKIWKSVSNVSWNSCPDCSTERNKKPSWPIHRQCRRKTAVLEYFKLPVYYVCTFLNKRFVVRDPRRRRRP